MTTELERGRLESGPAGESLPARRQELQTEDWCILGPGAAPDFLPSWPWEKWMARGKQVRPHLCPPGIVPLMDGHGRGLEGGQDDVVGRGQLYSDVVGAATVRSGGEPGGGEGLGLCTPVQRGPWRPPSLEAGRQQAHKSEPRVSFPCSAHEAQPAPGLPVPHCALGQAVCLRWASIIPSEKRGDPPGCSSEDVTVKSKGSLQR